ncbi:MAG: branched-chain amino acid ABC transporter permease [Actinobacteria bacterium]|nr:branched-chain amino acid ABC transporter permease [Actinomycetota bacterium]
MTEFLQTTEGVVTAAAIYLLIGLGWNLVYNTCGYLNLAMGTFYILGAVFSWKFETSLGITSPFILLILVCVSVGAIGFVSERLLLRRLGGNALNALIVTIGLNLMLLQLAMKLSPATVIRPELFVAGGISPGGVHISYQELIVWGTATVVTVGLFTFFTRTDLGRTMRACTDNRPAAEGLGIKVPTLATIAFTVSAILAALAAFVVAPTQGSAYNSGDLIAIKAFMAVSIVGLGRNGGAIFGAFLVAAVEGYVSRYWNPEISTIVVLTGFLVVLYVYSVRSTGGRFVPSWLRIRRRAAAAQGA